MSFSLAVVSIRLFFILRSIISNIMEINAKYELLKKHPKGSLWELNFYNMCMNQKKICLIQF